VEPPEPPQQPQDISLLGKAGGVVVAAGAGTTGLVYGGVLGLIRGAQELPGIVTSGARLGSRIAEPLTRTAGATLAVAVMGLIGGAFAIGALAAPVAGLLQGTVKGAAGKGPLVKSVARTVAQAGVTTGSAVLGAVGGALGALVGLCTLPTILYPPLGLKLIPQAVRVSAKVGFEGGSKAGAVVGNGLGTALGGVAGLTAAVVAATPQGASQALENVWLVAAGAKQLPRVAGLLWEDGQNAGKTAAYCTGGSVGAVLGTGAAVLSAGANVGVNSLSTAAQWGKSGYQWAVGHPKDSTGWQTR